ncbi:MAG: CsoS2 family carboxysome shell protein, partial [Rhodocyclaceae bacterium]|nr:CsoS2 family carboxysome shell protein [Rhodocyclaceae bacterium]
MAEARTQKTTDVVAGVTLSGRELAMQRRQAMARLGKVGAGKTAASSSQPARPRQAAFITPAASPMAVPSIAPAAPVNAARQRREALSRLGKAALPASAQQQARRDVARQASLSAVATASIAPAAEMLAVAPEQAVAACPAAEIAATSTISMNKPNKPTGRALAQARRAVLAQEGKSGLRRVAQATRIAAVMPDQNWQAAISQGATGRQVAMQRRIVQSLAGRVGDSASASAAAARPSGRIRPTFNKVEAPVKVEEAHTLGGQRVTGTVVERSKKVTGNEPGTCRAVTGTEYIGAEQYDNLCAARPPRGPLKVGVAQSEKGKTLTGTQVGRSAKVTGDESGADRKLTGTAYTAAADAARAPEKVAVTHTAQGKAVTGALVGSDPKITGDDRGNCQRVTGTEYLSAEQFQAECKTALPATAPKVSVMSSQGEQSVSGTAFGRSSKVTGDEPGSCRSVTGSQYYNTSDFAELCAAPSPRRAVSVMPSAAARAAGGASPKSSGDAAREASHVTATHPFGLDRQPASIIPAAAITTAVIPAYAVTGDRPGAGGAVLTGDERGACLPVSGTPYIGSDNAATQCAPSPASSGRFLSRAPSWQDVESPPPPIDFSILTPAREAQERVGGTVTGGDIGSQRITGPANKASGLITGTPDFRHQRATAPAAPAADVAGAAAQRLTGDGSQASMRVTGDAWHAQGRVTGTEGASA